MTSEALRKIDQCLEAGDEQAAAGLLASVDPAGVGSDRIAALVARARRIDRNDLALPLLGPSNRLLALHLRMEMGEAVADSMAELPGKRDAADPVVMPLAGALEMESRVDEAIALLEAALSRSPDWLAGYQTLVQLRWTAGKADASAPMRAALADRPTDEILHAAYLGTLKSMEDHDTLVAAVEAISASFPQSTLIAMVSAEALSEAGDLAAADRLFGQLAEVADPAFDAARMRHQMRAGRLDLVARIGAHAATTHGNPECWAWLGAALRLLDDPRADWFARGTDLVSTRRIDFDESERQQLADFLRQLHHASSPPFGQSPRGGTQTFGHLLKRREPVIVALRTALMKAVRAHVDALPPVEPQHPILGHKRSGLHFQGAWSILLRGGGHHVSHIHSHGWLSSAIYIDLPAGMDAAADEQGWLQIGVPPITGGKSPEPIMKVRPRPLELALFPSLVWHGTLPFQEGQRLTVAFDVTA
ncbi:2OG-Fe(II) oxygenase family protein [Sphingomicrobium flavum]|uniref:2OG-Fe(II) oxygenase family protein n=1 Tax=Sphingomicrobium flavum TaxID=1229164 RepID=UPI0021AD9961|nr:2OG-Fe(II) oxygenase family protein [Sphingomicrobium flavum]